MDNRLFAGYQSLNKKINDEYDSEWQDMLADTKDTQDVLVEKNDEYNFRKDLFYNAMGILNQREKEIIKLRRLSDKPKKLEELSQKFKISRERVRQIEERALQKLKKEVEKNI